MNSALNYPNTPNADPDCGFDHSPNPKPNPNPQPRPKALTLTPTPTLTLTQEVPPPLYPDPSPDPQDAVTSSMKACMQDTSDKAIIPTLVP